MGTGGPFPGGKGQPGHDADHSPPSSAKVNNEQELYLLSPQETPWHVVGSLYLFLSHKGWCTRSGVSGADINKSM
jgi:hypothetical protein